MFSLSLSVPHSSFFFEIFEYLVQSPKQQHIKKLYPNLGLIFFLALAGRQKYINYFLVFFSYDSTRHSGGETLAYKTRVCLCRSRVYR